LNITNEALTTRGETVVVDDTIDDVQSTCDADAVGATCTAATYDDTAATSAAEAQSRHRSA